jgi:hypothetical protein
VRFLSGGIGEIYEEMFNWNKYAAMVTVITEIEMHVIINNEVCYSA